MRDIQSDYPFYVERGLEFYPWRGDVPFCFRWSIPYKTLKRKFKVSDHSSLCMISLKIENEPTYDMLFWKRPPSPGCERWWRRRRADRLLLFTSSICRPRRVIGWRSRGRGNMSFVRFQLTRLIVPLWHILPRSSSRWTARRVLMLGLEMELLGTPVWGRKCRLSCFPDVLEGLLHFSPTRARLGWL